MKRFVLSSLGAAVAVAMTAGVALAGYARLREAFEGRAVAIIVCGANIGLDRLRGVLAG